MKAELDKTLYQLVVAALTIFVLVVLLLAALMLHQLWLQQRLARVSVNVEISLEDLEIITEDLQRELAEGQSLIDPGSLDEVNEQLDLIAEGIEELNETVLSQEGLGSSGFSGLSDERNSTAVQRQVNSVFTIFAILIGITSIIIAVFLAIAVKIHHNIEKV